MMQITLGSSSLPLSNGPLLNPAGAGGTGGFGSLLLGSVQQAVQNPAVLVPSTSTTSNDLSALLASLFNSAGGSEPAEELVGKKAELLTLAEELVEKGEMPTLQELAVLLQTDVETLQHSLQKLIHAVNGSAEEAGLENPLEDTGNPETDETLSIEQLTALISQLSEQVPPLLKEADKPFVVTAIRAAQLINYFAQHIQKPEPRFQALQTALENAEALVKQQLNNVLPQTKQTGLQSAAGLQVNTTPVNQASLEAAFTNYKRIQGPENSTESKVAALKPAAQAAEAVNPVLHPLSKTEQFVMSVKTTPRPMNMEQFIQKFEQILGSSNMLRMPNGTKMLIKLYPEQLGSLRIELLQQNGVMTAKILSSTQTVKELLEQNAHQLKHAFSQQNVTIDKLDIISSETKQQLFDRGAQQQRQQEQKQPEQESTEQNETEMLSTFEEALQNVTLEV
ncbi:flagellar hook-length control protein FliK [Domibacillus sp. DTU_2020_1001157_1_SI_ALB_TIR_016]|uniref:flagellar hook-length control protein FliK n=1 Tax=Domibacillus sp. DTU_2020_1001157_1_SI_ALB_TIR_016 TaxID=3077789 RepID=UPI0028EE2DB9|nr:flagellar hook-length control protein FliK [Domibacillus sp. DTU_2020_1001157_1_SI_ALB_TIR_016]WNS79725.1 flagellar hook-length control protein FliK [Domibacillus sp. DTU_2020_1001157_1_SI_ALB_TIR_016]